jgi:type IV secretion system protein TrbC
MQRNFLRAALPAIGLMLATSGQALASAQNLPWEAPLATIQASLTGPVAIAISIVAIMIAGAVLLFGGEINEFARRLIMVVLVVAVVAGAVSIFQTLFTAPGASIGQAGEGGDPLAVLIALGLTYAVWAFRRPRKKAPGAEAMGV